MTETRRMMVNYVRPNTSREHAGEHDWLDTCEDWRCTPIEPEAAAGATSDLDVAMDALRPYTIHMMGHDGYAKSCPACQAIRAYGEQAGAIQKCPVCDGTGLVSRPPSVAGDQPTWVDSQTGPYPCKRCEGRGTINLAEAVRKGDA